MLKSKNLFLLHVSATPYNIECIKKNDLNWREENLIFWDDVVLSEPKLIEENEKYFGKISWKKMLKFNLIQTQMEQSSECLKILVNLNEISHLLINKQILEVLSKNNL